MFFFLVFSLRCGAWWWSASRSRWHVGREGGWAVGFVPFSFPSFSVGGRMEISPLPPFLSFRFTGRTQTKRSDETIGGSEARWVNKLLGCRLI